MDATSEAVLRGDGALLAWELRALWIVFSLYLISSLRYLAWMFLPGPANARKASRLLVYGAFLQLVALALRVIQAGRLPFHTPYECFVWFILLSVLAYLFVERKSGGIFVAGGPVAAISACFCLYALLGADPAATSLSPSLRNTFFLLHNIAAQIAYAAFVAAFSIEATYVFIVEIAPAAKLSRYGLNTDSAARFHRGAHRLALFGFPVLMASLLFGALWTEQTWGRYWAWTPRETLSLMTAIVYVLYLHSMTMASWRGLRASFLSLLGFVCIVVSMWNSG